MMGACTHTRTFRREKTAMKKIIVPVDTDDAAYIIEVLCERLQYAEERAEAAEEELAYRKECGSAWIEPPTVEGEEDDTI